jgi:transcriptional regulator with XRE-family HTH domain
LGEVLPGTEAGQAETGLEIQAIGAAIRELRLQHGLTLRDLSQRSGLSSGFLSLVERGLASPALTSLSAIAKALGVEMATLFSQQPSSEGSASLHVSHVSDDGQLTLISSGRIYKLLSERAPDLVLEPLLVTIPPNTHDAEPYGHEGEEFAYVLSGRLRFVIDRMEYQVGPGDTVHFRSTVPHAIHNDQDVPVRAIWVLTPRML